MNVVVDWGVITLPRGSVPQPRFAGAEGAPGPLAVGQAGAGLRILMVEDDPALSMMYQVRLEAAGYTVVLATDGEAALRQVRADKQIDLVFLDIGLPGMDGLEVLEAIRNLGEQGGVPVVILSNYNEPPMKQRGMSLGAIAYLVKSEITPSGLVARIPGWARG